MKRKIFLAVVFLLCGIIFFTSCRHDKKYEVTKIDTTHTVTSITDVAQILKGTWHATSIKFVGQELLNQMQTVGASGWYDACNNPHGIYNHGKFYFFNLSFSDSLHGKIERFDSAVDIEFQPIVSSCTEVGMDSFFHYVSHRADSIGEFQLNSSHSEISFNTYSMGVNEIIKWKVQLINSNTIKIVQDDLSMSYAPFIMRSTFYYCQQFSLQLPMEIILKK